MKIIQNDILSYREMCNSENQEVMQRGMNFRMNPAYSVILMSQRVNAPYLDKVHNDGITIEYEGHNIPKNYGKDPKTEDQIAKLPSGKLTQNGYFIRAVNNFKLEGEKPELVKIYEKVFPGVWSFKGYFDLIDYKIIRNQNRNIFRYILKLSDRSENSNVEKKNLEHSRLIPSEVKKEVWKRDGGKCVICGDNKNLHFDHDLPFSKGGTSLTAKNVKLLCVNHNLQKSNKIE